MGISLASVLQQDKGYKLPKRMQADFSKVVQALADQSSANVHKAIGGALIGVGAVLGGLGAYWLLSDTGPQTPAVHFSPSGASLSWKF